MIPFHLQTIKFKLHWKNISSKMIHAEFFKCYKLNFNNFQLKFHMNLILKVTQINHDNTLI